MAGMNRHTGKLIDGVAELRQSVHDVLSTPVGTRVMNREYGSGLFALVDAPVDRQFAVQMFQATAEAVRRWEPRFRLERVDLAEITDTGPVFDLHGTDLQVGIGVILEQL